MRVFFSAMGLGALLSGAVAAQGDSQLAPINCLIEPEEMVRLSTPVAGIVAAVHVDRGDSVAAGDVVAELDATLETIALSIAAARAGNSARVLGAEARVAFLEAQTERNRQLAARNALSVSVLTESELELEIARQDLDEARLSRDLASIELTQARAVRDQKVLRAPIDGVIVERLLSRGEYRDTQAHIATIARLDLLRVEAFAPLRYFDGMAVGDAVTIRPEEPVGGAWPATITVIDRVFDAATATFGLRMALENPDLLLPAGVRCEVHFDGGAGVTTAQAQAPR